MRRQDSLGNSVPNSTNGMHNMDSGMMSNGQLNHSLAMSHASQQPYDQWNSSNPTLIPYNPSHGGMTNSNPMPDYIPNYYPSISPPYLPNLSGGAGGDHLSNSHGGGGGHHQLGAASQHDHPGMAAPSLGGYMNHFQHHPHQHPGAPLGHQGGPPNGGLHQQHHQNVTPNAAGGSGGALGSPGSPYMSAGADGNGFLLGGGGNGGNNYPFGGFPNFVPSGPPGDFSAWGSNGGGGSAGGGPPMPGGSGNQIMNSVTNTGAQQHQQLNNKGGLGGQQQVSHDFYRFEPLDNRYSNFAQGGGGSGALDHQSLQAVEQAMGSLVFNPPAVSSSEHHVMGGGGGMAPHHHGGSAGGGVNVMQQLTHLAGVPPLHQQQQQDQRHNGGTGMGIGGHPHDGSGTGGGGVAPGIGNSVGGLMSSVGGQGTHHSGSSGHQIHPHHQHHSSSGGTGGSNMGGGSGGAPAKKSWASIASQPAKPTLGTKSVRQKVPIGGPGAKSGGMIGSSDMGGSPGWADKPSSKGFPTPGLSAANGTGGGRQWTSSNHGGGLMKSRTGSSSGGNENMHLYGGGYGDDELADYEGGGGHPQVTGSLGTGLGDKSGPGGDESSGGGGVPHTVLNTLRSKNQYNPKEFTLNTRGARYFVIKSYSEDDIHRSIKYGIWCSTEHGNKRLDNAFRERDQKGPIYLFYSVNGSGHFCGIAQMLSPVDYNKETGIWAQDKWKGSFGVKWIYVKDVPNQQLRHIRLENNENKPVTNSRDTQEVPPEKGRQVMLIIHRFKHSTCIFDDFFHYEKRQEEEEVRKVKPEPTRGGEYVGGLEDDE